MVKQPLRLVVEVLIQNQKQIQIHIITYIQESSPYYLRVVLMDGMFILKEEQMVIHTKLVVLII
ncbi:MAG: hypothetical protein EBT27_09575 [Betaproteobacteria bacterium]|nr:hypothetical protein [Betaproteobacteria bacterium]